MRHLGHGLCWLCAALVSLLGGCVQPAPPAQATPPSAAQRSELRVEAPPAKGVMPEPGANATPSAKPALRVAFAYVGPVGEQG